MARQYDVLVVSNYFVDLVFTLPKLPNSVGGLRHRLLDVGGVSSAAAMRQLGLLCRG